MVPAAASAEHAVAGNLRLDRDQGLQTRRGRHGQIDLMPLTTPAERAVALCYLRAEKCCICPKRPAQKSRFVPQIVMNCALACPHDADGTATAKTAAEFMPWAAGPAIVRGSPVPLRLGRPLGRAAARVVGRSGARGRTAPGVSGWRHALGLRIDFRLSSLGWAAAGVVLRRSACSRPAAGVLGRKNLCANSACQHDCESVFSEFMVGS